MHKILAITIPILFISFIVFQEWEYSPILALLLAVNIGWEIPYLWCVNDMRDLLYRRIKYIK
jgi:hypothetical protein